MRRSSKRCERTGRRPSSTLPARRGGQLSLRATRLPGEPCPGVMIVLHDMTELRRLESLRRELVANVSHELKTPLAAIKGYAETLRLGAVNDQEHNLHFVRRIEEQADRLARADSRHFADCAARIGARVVRVDRCAACRVDRGLRRPVCRAGRRQAD